jgi:hypothetical protein
VKRDLYQEWLGVEPGRRPPDHYALLLLPRFRDDMDAVESGARRQMDRLDKYALHPDRELRDAVQRMMNEVARARVCLVNPARKKEYDKSLAAQLGLSPPAEQPVEPALPRAVVLAAEAPPRDNVPAFERTARAHLRKWNLDAWEERFLLAEAAALGVDAETARRLIHRIDEEAEERAAKVHRRWQVGAVGAALAVMIGAAMDWAAPPHPDLGAAVRPPGFERIGAMATTGCFRAPWVNGEPWKRERPGLFRIVRQAKA